MKKNLRIIICVVLLFITSLVLFFATKSYYLTSDRSSKIMDYTKKGYPVMGWVRVQGTNIDYPVLFSQDDNFDIDNVDIGFAWTNSMNTKLNDRVIISGHNIRNVSSSPLVNEKNFNNFENLPSFLYYDFVEENKYIQYTIDNNNYIYKIYSVSMINESDFSYDENMEEKNKKEYIKKTIEDSYFDFDIDVNSNDKLITLTTCTRFFGDTQTLIKIDGRLVRNGEKKKNYKVTKKDKYNKILKIMKGDVIDEKA